MEGCSRLMQYALFLLSLVGVYVMASVSLDLLMGFTGLLSISHAAFVGIGAYAVALLTTLVGASFTVSLLVAVVLGGMAGILVAISSLRLRRDLFAIGTFAFQVIAYGVMVNWLSLTEGPMGIPGIPRPIVLGHQPATHAQFLAIVATACGLALWISRRIGTSPYGRVLRAIREDEALSEANGKNVDSFKISVFAVGAALASVSGGLYACLMSFIDPSSFSAMESIFLISLVVVGGAGSAWGPPLGAALLVTLPELLRLIGVPGAVSGNLRQIAYGGLLVLFMLCRPQGLLGGAALRFGTRE